MILFLLTSMVKGGAEKCFPFAALTQQLNAAAEYQAPFQWGRNLDLNDRPVDQLGSAFDPNSSDFILLQAIRKGNFEFLNEYFLSHPRDKLAQLSRWVRYNRIVHPLALISGQLYAAHKDLPDAQRFRACFDLFLSDSQIRNELKRDLEHELFENTLYSSRWGSLETVVLPVLKYIRTFEQEHQALPTTGEAQ